MNAAVKRLRRELKDTAPASPDQLAAAAANVYWSYHGQEYDHSERDGWGRVATMMTQFHEWVTQDGDARVATKEVAAGCEAAYHQSALLPAPQDPAFTFVAQALSWALAADFETMPFKEGVRQMMVSAATAGAATTQTGGPIEYDDDE